MPNLYEANAKNINSVSLSPEVQSLIRQAGEIRTANFPMEITAVCPSKTRTVSVTGTTCALDCAHCGRHYLKGMLPLDAVLAGQCKPQPKSYLISGGFTSEGKVPLTPHIEQLHQLGKTSRLNLHPGLVSREEARTLASVADVVSFDFAVSTNIIRKVYGLHKDISDYINSYRSLVESMGNKNVVPHITIGLLGGQISDEIKAVKLLAAEGISRLVLLVLIPTPGTRFGKLPPPNLSDVTTTIARIRILLPTVPIYLGCMRPGGIYRRHLDYLALQCGLNKIVQPARNVEAAAHNFGLTIKYEEECCAL